LQSPEGRWELGERRAVTQRSRLALDDREIMPPVEDGRCALAFVGASEDAGVFADDLPLGGDDDALGIDAHTDRSISERGRHAVAIAVEMDEACRRDALGVLDEAIEWPRKLHQTPHFFGPGVGYRTR
jgi:hypothetical protein